MTGFRIPPGHLRGVALLLFWQLLTTAVAAHGEAISWIHGFERGVAQSGSDKRPAFIYFQAPWCSWCHRYEKHTLADPAVVEMIQNHFVPVLVNYDERPDLVKRYRGFGLPFTVILDSDGQLLARLPGILSPEDMLRTLQQLGSARQPQQQRPERRLQPDGLDREAYQQFLAHWLERLEDLYEPATGGFSGVLESGATLKRSTPRAWSFLLEQNLWAERSRTAALATLERLHDPRHGGFFYFRDPHREDRHLETAKMLDANAWLIAWFATAGTRYGDAALLDAAQRSFDYLRNTLWDCREGGFFQSQISDAAYYKAPDGMATPPPIDAIKRTDGNAQAAIALLDADALLKNEALADYALEAVRYLLKNHLQQQRLYHSRDSDGLGPAYNLPEDIFWLLAAVQSVEAATPFTAPASDKQLLYRLADQWLEAAMQKDPAAEFSNELLGAIALAALGSDSQLLSGRAAQWALREIHIEPSTRPDELVPALAVWQRVLERKKRLNSANNPLE